MPQIQTRHEFVKYMVAGKAVRARRQKGISSLSDRELIRMTENGKNHKKVLAGKEIARRIKRGRFVVNNTPEVPRSANIGKMDNLVCMMPQ